MVCFMEKYLSDGVTGQLGYARQIQTGIVESFVLIHGYFGLDRAQSKAQGLKPFLA
jgi:hypothetical protein